VTELHKPTGATVTSARERPVQHDRSVTARRRAAARWNEADDERHRSHGRRDWSSVLKQRTWAERGAEVADENEDPDDAILLGLAVFGARGCRSIVRSGYWRQSTYRWRTTDRGARAESLCERGVETSGFDEDVLQASEALGLPHFPGMAIASEVQVAAWMAARRCSKTVSTSCWP